MLWLKLLNIKLIVDLQFEWLIKSIYNYHYDELLIMLSLTSPEPFYPASQMTCT